MSVKVAYRALVSLTTRRWSTVSAVRVGLRVGELLGVAILLRVWEEGARVGEALVSRTELAMYRKGVSKVSAMVRGIA
jgi:hypothetical protein